MNHLESMLQAAHERQAALTPPEPEAPAPPACLREALAGRERPGLIGCYTRLEPGEQEERPALPALRRLQSSGLDAVAVVTESACHGGRMLDLELAAEALDLPLIMSDIVLDPLQVSLAAALGCSGVELVARVLEGNSLAELVAACDEHGLLPLVQCFDQQDVERALGQGSAGLRLTDQDLATLARRREAALALLDAVPAGRLCIAPGDLEDASWNANLRGRVDALWFGRGLLESQDPSRALQEMLS